MTKQKFIHIFNIERNGRSTRIFKAAHLNVSRTGDRFVRDMFIDNKRYKDILTMAIKHGLFSFRYQNEVVITFFNSYGIGHALLVEVYEDSIRIVTVYSSKQHQVWSFFIKIQNRINLWNYYTMPTLSKQEYAAKQADIKAIHIEISSEKEDKYFQQAMKKL